MTCTVPSSAGRFHSLPEIQTNKPITLYRLPATETTTLGRLAPPALGLRHRGTDLSFVGTPDECQPLMVDRVPLVVERLEGESLLVVGAVGQQRATVAGVLLHLRPENVT